MTLTRIKDRAAPFYGLAAALGIGLPLLLGVVTGRLDRGTLAGLGAFLLAFTAPSGPYSARARSLAVSVLARFPLLPTLLFIVTVLAIVAVGLVRTHPAATVGAPAPLHAHETLGALLILKAFSAGCTALTGVEAIANGVPMFRKPRVAHAQRTELMLGALLAAMLIGLALLIRRDDVLPREGVTILAQLTAGALGTGWIYQAASLVIAFALILAANTSFGGLPVLLSLLAKDHRLPHLFALRGERPVHRYGVLAVAVAAAALLIAVDARTHRLLPLFAVGVFTGFTISQTGLVLHWTRLRPPRGAGTALINGTGAALTGVATLCSSPSSARAPGRS
ncbi:hypothetical protein GCM10010182_12720 [Actinomadura cremea]|nr:hypothetical protein GCM10010182_12720 [Actinomadura cremea]